MPASPRLIAFSTAGTLGFDTFVGAIFRAAVALDRGATIPGVTQPVSVADLYEAALSAITPYCDNDRIGAAEAVAAAFTPDWPTWPPGAQEHAIAQGEALLIWLERLDPACN